MKRRLIVIRLFSQGEIGSQVGSEDPQFGSLRKSPAEPVRIFAKTSHIHRVLPSSLYHPDPVADDRFACDISIERKEPGEPDGSSIEVMIYR